MTRNIYTNLLYTDPNDQVFTTTASTATTTFANPVTWINWNSTQAPGPTMSIYGGNNLFRPEQSYLVTTTEKTVAVLAPFSFNKQSGEEVDYSKPVETRSLRILTVDKTRIDTSALTGDFALLASNIYVFDIASGETAHRLYSGPNEFYVLDQNLGSQRLVTKPRGFKEESLFDVYCSDPDGLRAEIFAALRSLVTDSLPESRVHFLFSGLMFDNGIPGVLQHSAKSFYPAVIVTKIDRHSSRSTGPLLEVKLLWSFFQATRFKSWWSDTRVKENNPRTFLTEIEALVQIEQWLTTSADRFHYWNKRKVTRYENNRKKEIIISSVKDFVRTQPVESLPRSFRSALSRGKKGRPFQYQTARFYYCLVRKEKYKSSIFSLYHKAHHSVLEVHGYKVAWIANPGLYIRKIQIPTIDGPVKKSALTALFYLGLTVCESKNAQNTFTVKGGEATKEFTGGEVVSLPPEMFVRLLPLDLHEHLRDLDTAKYLSTANRHFNSEGPSSLV